MAVGIVNRLHKRLQQKQQNPRSLPKLQNRFNDRKIWQKLPKSTAYGTHAGHMNVDAAQKTGQNEITYYDCGQKGRVKKNCKPPYKSRKPAPRNESAAAEKDTRETSMTEWLSDETDRLLHFLLTETEVDVGSGVASKQRHHRELERGLQDGTKAPRISRPQESIPVPCQIVANRCSGERYWK
jgi:hypothetical protein